MIVNLLSNPRNVSTALMYAFAQRSDFNVMDEPYYAYYLQYSGVNHPGRKQILSHQPKTAEEIWQWVLRVNETTDHVFIKNMAHHIYSLKWDFCKNCFNVIFIRDPKEVLASFSKVVEAPTLDDIAIKFQFDLASHFEEKGWDYLIFDAATLTGNPEKALMRLCQSLGIEYSYKMTSWPKGPKTYDGVWSPFWYNNVHSSTGFKSKAHFGENPLPGPLKEVYETALPYYESLASRAMVLM